MSNPSKEEQMADYLADTPAQTFSIKCTAKEVKRAIRQIALFINCEKDGD